MDFPSVVLVSPMGAGVWLGEIPGVPEVKVTATTLSGALHAAEDAYQWYVAERERLLEDRQGGGHVR